MVENPDNQNNSENKNQNKDKENAYKFKRAHLSLDDSQYFKKLKSNYEKSKQAKRKVEPERQDIKRHIQRIKQQLKKCDSEKKREILNKDLAFFQACLPAMKVVEAMIDQGLATAKRILESGIKQPYKLVIDFKRMPCPSERMFGKDKKKDKDKDKNKDSNKKPGEEKDKSPKRDKKMSMEKLKEMRGLSKDTPIAPLKDSGFVKAGEKINVEGLKLAPEFAADKNGKAVNEEEKEAAAATPGQKKNRKKSLAEYKKQYGFTHAAQRKGVVRPVQNVNSLTAAGKSGGR